MYPDVTGIHSQVFDFVSHPLSATPYGAALELCLILAALCWLLSVITREYSWVDRIWPICPPIYGLMVAANADFVSPRLNLMATLVTLWGARLTFNCARKGGFAKGGEDYRWVAMREKLSPAGFQVLNLAFIAPGQMLIVWLFAAPIHQATTPRLIPLPVRLARRAGR